MTSHDDKREAEIGESEDVTLAASGDVVAQIRAHAAKVRRGEVAADEELQVWTPPAEEVRVEEPLLPPDPTVPFKRAQQVVRVEQVERVVRRVVEPGESLIENTQPPEVSATFWTSDQPFRASGIDSKPRRVRAAAVPLWVWVAVVAVVIVVVSVGIAVAIATAGTVQ